jgi:hypothetical protein
MFAQDDLDFVFGHVAGDGQRGGLVNAATSWW